MSKETDWHDKISSSGLKMLRLSKRIQIEAELLYGFNISMAERLLDYSRILHDCSQDISSALGDKVGRDFNQQMESSFTTLHAIMELVSKIPDKK